MIRRIVSEIIALLDDFGHVSVLCDSIVVGMEICNAGIASTGQADSKMVSFVHVG